MSTKVRCADCIWCCDLRITDEGELVNLCEIIKDEMTKGYWYYETLRKFKCNIYKERITKAKIRHINYPARKDVDFSVRS